MNKDEKKTISGNNALSITGSLPFEGRWTVGATPDEIIPSHGTDLFGVGYAIDFMAVDSQNETSRKTSWRTHLSSEAPEIFYAFGKPIFSPVSGEIISIHNGELDHKAYRSLVTLIPYAVTQRSRMRKGPEAIAGNYIVIAPHNTDIYIAIVHLQLDSLIVKKGDHVIQGEHIANCGNSGNSTQPHIHIQAMSSADFYNTVGIPLYFNEFTQQKKGLKELEVIRRGFPATGAVVSPN
ncbi:M23 family metallopeptidase [Marinilactibacillus psychrotolerans]|uniref:M23 family metallopeptidase n=1 Tax=Marinilactibacillus psychrotolerans TaxID=191770 RepID=UPI001D889852|nr:M23 family metallopeptidase [Marinilactibacillus psychrotolerans]GEQ33693.1 peptidase M23 [Marinilactibacillus psychrotolerans]